MFSWPEVDHEALRRARRDRVAEMMQRVDVDHLLLTGFDNIRYVTDYRTLIIAEAFDWFAAVADRDGSCEIFVPWVDEPTPDPEPDLPLVQLLHPLPSWTPALPHVSYWLRSITDSLRRRGAKRVGFEMVYGELLDGLRQELPSVVFTPVTTELHDLRLEKHPIEVELLAAASTVNSRAAEAAMDGAQAGMRDHDVLALAMDSLQTAGVEFLSHSLCNVRRGSGTWFSVGNELAEGDAFFFDIGCYGPGGYASDMARTGFVGEPPPEVSAAYGRLLEALRVGEDMVRPGIHASQIHEAINGYLAQHQLPITPYAMGHGVGLRACELPTIHRSDRVGRDQTISEGMVISLEPETAVRIGDRTILVKVEDNYLVTGDGLQRLTDAHYGLELASGH
jgi:Xaa-Pro dipeptidase